MPRVWWMTMDGTVNVTKGDRGRGESRQEGRAPRLVALAARCLQCGFPILVSIYDERNNEYTRMNGSQQITQIT